MHSYQTNFHTENVVFNLEPSHCYVSKHMRGSVSTLCWECANYKSQIINVRFLMQLKKTVT
jgi:hypothetical protein